MDPELLKILTRLEAKIDRIEERLNRRDEIEREIRRTYDAVEVPIRVRSPIIISPPSEEEIDDIFDPVKTASSGKLKNLLIDTLLETVQNIEVLEKDEIEPSEVICGIYDLIDKREEDLPVWNFDCLAECKNKKKILDRLHQLQAIVGSMTEEELQDPNVFAKSVKDGLKSGIMIDGIMGLLSGEGDFDNFAKSMGMETGTDNKIGNLLKGLMTPEMKTILKDAFQSEGSQNMVSGMKSMFSGLSSGNTGDLMNKSILDLAQNPRILGMIKAQISRPPKEEYEKEILSFETPPKLTIDSEQQCRMISKMQTSLGGYNIFLHASNLGRIYYIFILIGQKRYDELQKFLQIDSLEQFDRKITELFGSR